MQEAKQKKAKLRVMFEDESRFGRISDIRRCWFPKGQRPIVSKQMIREYAYVYGAFSPKDGQSDMVILPRMDTACINWYLQEVSKRHKQEYLIMFMDGAASHRAKALEIPQNIRIERLPAYSPELNPAENIWRKLKEENFYNRSFGSLEEIEEQLCVSIQELERNRMAVQKTTCFSWIKCSLMKEN